MKTIRFKRRWPQGEMFSSGRLTLLADRAVSGDLELEGPRGTYLLFSGGVRFHCRFRAGDLVRVGERLAMRVAGVRCERAGDLGEADWLRAGVTGSGDVWRVGGCHGGTWPTARDAGLALVARELGAGERDWLVLYEVEAWSRIG